MGHKFIFTNKAKNDLKRLGDNVVIRISKKLAWIEEQQYPLRSGLLLTDSHIGDIRFRVGVYRVIADIDHDKKY
ncbi:hypothetical protein COU88_00705, partial [Candidatus Roizmanbacteria bacterium CG10_big_fil_rev_8_21_14_0_10_39_6]